MFQAAKPSRVKFLRFELPGWGGSGAVVRDKDGQRGASAPEHLESHTRGLEVYSGSNEDFLKVLK